MELSRTESSGDSVYSFRDWFDLAGFGSPSGRYSNRLDELRVLWLTPLAELPRLEEERHRERPGWPGTGARPAGDLRLPTIVFEADLDRWCARALRPRNQLTDCHWHVTRDLASKDAPPQRSHRAFD